MIGGALQELGPALSLSKSSELALAPSAKGILASTTNLGGEERGEGYLCIPLLSADGPEDLAASSAADSDVSDKIGSLTTISELARRLLAAQQEDDGGMRKLGSIGGLNLLAGHHNLFQGDGDDAARPAIANLMRFTLPFVSARLKQTIMNADLLLSEHRQISVLFITGGVQVESHLIP